MNGKTVFERMTGVSDKFLEEAAFIPQGGTVLAPPRRCRRENWLTRFAGSGWGVACICFVVAVAAVVGMAAWGRMGDMTGPGNDPSVRFAFSYEMTDNDGSAWSGTALPGDVVNVSTSIVNHGKTFVADDFFAYATFVSQEDESIVIEGHYPAVESNMHTVKNGEQSDLSFHFHIPENATLGIYDLVLSYDGVQQVFGGVLTVERGSASETSSHPNGDWRIPEVSPLPEDVESEIIGRYLEEKLTSEFTEEDISLRYYGQYGMVGKAYVMFVDVKDMMYGEMLCEDVVNGLCFEYTDTHTLTVYCDGDFYTLPEAFELGYLSEDDVWKLYKIYVAEEITGRYAYEQKIQAERISLRILYAAQTVTDHIATAYALYVDVEGNDRLTAEVVETVNGLAFIYSDGQPILVYRGYGFYTLTEAFQQGFLDERELESLYAVHNGYRMALQGVTPPDETLCRRMQELYVQDNYQRYDGDIAVEDVSFRYYGSYGGGDTHVMFADVEGWVYITAQSGQDEVNGLRFTYPTSQKLLVYHNGFWSLSEAFARGYLSADDLLRLYTVYKHGSPTVIP